MKTKVVMIAVALLIIVGAGTLFWFFNFTGRTPSRYLGKNFSQTLKAEHMQRLVGPVSMYQDGASTIKDVTYQADDGYIYTREFKDVSPLGGVIRWVPADQSDSFVQSRAISRFTGGAVSLQLPEDCAELLGVIISPTLNGNGKATGERVKNITYRSTSGKFLSKEYREGIIDRNFGGWLEVARE